MNKVLIVDDHGENLYLLRVLLEGSGYEVLSATNGSEALEVARGNPPDLIVSDILMPIMDGFALCRQWHSDDNLKEIPFIFYTATYTDEKDKEFALSLGAQRFIIKPQEPENFIKIIKESIQLVDTAPKIPGRSAPPMDLRQDEEFLKEYNATLVRKLETKMEELEKANRELVLKNALLEGHSELALDGILIVDAQGKQLYANKRFVTMWKIPLKLLDARDDEAILKHVVQQLKDGDEFLRKIKYLYENRQERSHEEIEFTDGKVFDRYSAPLLESKGKYLGRVWYFRDITERKRKEEEIQKHLHDLEIFYNANISREERIVELKKKIHDLEDRLGAK